MSTSQGAAGFVCLPAGTAAAVSQPNLLISVRTMPFKPIDPWITTPANPRQYSSNHQFGCRGLSRAVKVLMCSVHQLQFAV
eukprot:363494-Chlamydomonas_euryale.AAC.3